jgi:hypothetical protein
VTLRRRCAGAALLALALVAGVATLSQPASAATAYRYWSYYIAAASAPGSWVYSQRGPASEHPQDGEVQGWRFAVQADSASATAPRTPPDFDRLCASSPAAAGKLRVGIVLDFGVADDAPAGERPPASVVTGCVQVPAGANGVDVLDAAVGAANVRIGQGLICGIDGYPKTECAAVVTAPTPTATRTPTSTKAPASTPTKTPAVTTQPATTDPAVTPTITTSTRPTVQPASSFVEPAPSPPPTRTPTASDGASISTLGALKKPSHKGFPIGAIIGGVLIVGLGIAAAARAVVARRSHP